MIACGSDAQRVDLTPEATTAPLVPQVPLRPQRPRKPRTRVRFPLSQLSSPQQRRQARHLFRELQPLSSRKRGRVVIPDGAFQLADTSIHSVPLSEILFDTFGAFPWSLPVDSGKDHGHLELRDALTAMGTKEYGPLDALSWMRDDSLILGHASGEDAYAYPINGLNMREIVNDVINGVPVLVNHCHLCFSGMVYHRELDGKLLTYGNTSALYLSDMVMYDHHTDSYWFCLLYTSPSPRD